MSLFNTSPSKMEGASVFEAFTRPANEQEPTVQDRRRILYCRFCDYSSTVGTNFRYHLEKQHGTVPPSPSYPKSKTVLKRNLQSDVKSARAGSHKASSGQWLIPSSRRPPETSARRADDQLNEEPDGPGSHSKAQQSRVQPTLGPKRARHDRSKKKIRQRDSVGRSTEETLTTSEHSIRHSHSNETIPQSYQRPVTSSAPFLSEEQSAQQEKRSKPCIEFVYRIVLSRSPVYKSKGFQPQGKFQEKSIERLIQELPIEGHIKGLVLTMEGPGVSMEERFDNDDEACEIRFEGMKRAFKKQLSARVAASVEHKKVLVVDIEIELLRDNQPEDFEKPDLMDLDDW